MEPHPTASAPASVVAHAPVRICDAGGWTDTWFASSGLVCSVAAGPGAEVAARVVSSGGDPSGAGGSVAGDGVRVTLDVVAYGDRYTFEAGRGPGRHPLLEAAIAASPLGATPTPASARPSSPTSAPAKQSSSPSKSAGPSSSPGAPGVSVPGMEVEVTVRAAPPPGCGTGTSAAVVVALLGALRALAGEPTDPGEVAAAAHRVEADDLGLQSGVQDQQAAAHGGACSIAVDDYPAARTDRLPLDASTVEALRSRVVTVYLGRPHRSSAIHEQVIASLEGSGRRAEDLLAALRDAAGAAAAALSDGDLERWAAALTANTEAQARLHPGLVGDDARHLASIARSHGAVGWKVNGAGGDGGTVSIVGPEGPADMASMISAIADAAASTGWRVLPLTLDLDGLRITHL